MANDPGTDGGLRVSAAIIIPGRELEERFARSPGPGGQNVNKVETAVQLRFDAANSVVLSDAVRLRLARLAGRRLGSDGVVTIDAHRFRSRERNREDARERLAALVRRAASPPPVRRPTRAPARVERERLATKHHRAARKRLRARPEEE